MKHIYLSLLIIVLGCASQKMDNNSNEDYQVLNAYLAHKSEPLTLNINSLFLNENPAKILSRYIAWEKRSKSSNFLFKNKKWLFDKEEIEDMKLIYKEWKNIEWDKKKFIQMNPLS